MSILMPARLPHTWPVFFARHGNLTRVQQEAIGPILDGRNTLVAAATASGKTEAAIAPLLERHVLDTAGAGPRQERIRELRILYICPTRALVRDLYARLAGPLAELGVALAMKSGDTGPVSVAQPPTVLITTPESTDSLLTRAPRLLGALRAVVLDEIHQLDGTPRGDHVRCLLRRIEHIRDYRSQELGQAAASLQRVALSATIPNPEGTAQRYLVDREQPQPVAIVWVPGRPRVTLNVQRMTGPDDLVAALTLGMAGQTRRRKTLVFCNTRREVEAIAAYLRGHLPFESAVFVHYSNLDPALRREVEAGLAEASTALCVCTSTLELGIDIGSIDMVVLVGPPPTPAALVQRMGRGGRRRRAAYIVGLARSTVEEVRFAALLDLAGKEQATNGQASPPFHLSVLVQQVFSILKQSPTGGIRLADLRRATPEPAEDDAGGVRTDDAGDMISDWTLRRLLNHLTVVRYLKPGRPGEWRAGPALEELVDAYEIYSNIGADPLSAVVVDAYTGRPLAQTAHVQPQGDTLLIGGRRMEVVWRDRYRIGVQPTRQGVVEAQSHLHATPFAVPWEVSQAVAARLGFAAGEMAWVQDEAGGWLFHFWGDLYGELLARLHQIQCAPQAATTEDAEMMAVTRGNEHCQHLPAGCRPLPVWDERVVRRELARLVPRLEACLELGRFHSLLPAELATRVVVEHFDLPRFERLYRAAKVVTPVNGQRKRLLRLLE